MPQRRLFDSHLMERAIRHILSTSIILFAICAFSACTTPPGIGGIEANIKQIHADENRDITATLLFVNDSTRPIAIQSAEHRIFIAGHLAGHARMTTPLGLPPLSSAERTVTVVPDNTLGHNFLNDAARTPGAYWRLNSRLAINNGGEDVILRSDTNGELGKH